MRILFILSIVACLFGLTSHAGAGPLEDGMKAYERKNFAKAFPLLLPQAEQGNAKAQYAVGRMYEDGYGVAQDYTEAAKWYRMSAEQGDPHAQHALSVMYAVGWGVPADARESAMWVRKAAIQGYYYAENDLGSKYANGRGVPKDYVLAYMWFDLGATTAPSSVAGVIAKSRDEVAKQMTPEQIARAKELANQCRTSNFAKCE